MACNANTFTAFTNTITTFEFTRNLRFINAIIKQLKPPSYLILIFQPIFSFSFVSFSSYILIFQSNFICFVPTNSLFHELSFIEDLFNQLLAETPKTYMATKAKDCSVVGKEKKGPSSNSPLTSTRKTPKPSTTNSTKDMATSSPSEKQVPNYLKPTISSRLESHSFKLPRSDAAANKPVLNRRRSFDKPPSPSRLTKQNQPSLSRQNKALVSPGPRDRSIPFRSKTFTVKSTNPSKPILERGSKTPKEVKTEPSIAIGKKSSTTTSTTKKVAADDASVNSTNTTKSAATAGTTESINVETEPEVKEAINEEVGEIEKVENQEHEVENISEVPPHVESEPEHDNEHQQEPEESDQPHIQADDHKKVIPTELPEEKEEQIKDEHEEGENTNQDESNINKSQPEMNHSTNEEVEVKEKEEEVGLANTIEEDKKNEEEAVEGGTSEEVKLKEGEHEQEQVEGEVKEAKAESPEPKQEADARVHGKKEAQVSNDKIEETTSKLMEERKNKVRALAGAFQSVIDYQTK